MFENANEIKINNKSIESISLGNQGVIYSNSTYVTRVFSVVWDDDNDTNGYRPSSVIVKLSDGGQVIISEDDGWTKTVKLNPDIGVWVSPIDKYNPSIDLTTENLVINMIYSGKDIPNTPLKPMFSFWDLDEYYEPI